MIYGLLQRSEIEGLDGSVEAADDGIEGKGSFKPAHATQGESRVIDLWPLNDRPELSNNHDK